MCSLSYREMKNGKMNIVNYQMPIKVEPECDQDNCEDATDLTICDKRDNGEYEHVPYIKEEDIETEILMDDNEEAVVLKDELASNQRKDPLQHLNMNVNEASKNRIDIKYEDDIELEDYYSDEDSVDHSETSVLNSNESDSFNASNFANILNRSNMGKPFGGSSHPPPGYLDPSVLNFDLESSIEESGIEQTLANNGFTSSPQNKDSDKSNDSILLSIVYATINVPFSQVSKFLTAYNLSKSQLSIIRKVRRQVKNRLYAQNCRKRRVAHIKNLANELKQIRAEKEKLCSVREDLNAQLINLQYRYKQLHTYVMSSLSEKCRNQQYQCSEESKDENSEIYKLQKRKIIEESESLEIKKFKVEEKYEELYKHIFKVIATRYQNNGVSRGGVDSSSIDFKLCNMNIVNELAMLNKYWSKNNITSTDMMDFESSISVDGSRTSENKMSDFVDYESSISNDGSHIGESALHEDFIDYESATEENNTVAERNKKMSVTNTVVPLPPIIPPPNDKLPVESPNSGNKGRLNDESLIIWSENSDDDEEEEEEEEKMETFRIHQELYAEKRMLEVRKRAITEQYEKLYYHVLTALNVSETDFLKVFLDYCVRIKMLANDNCNEDAFNGS